MSSEIKANIFCIVLTILVSSFVLRFAHGVPFRSYLRMLFFMPPKPKDEAKEEEGSAGYRDPCDLADAPPGKVYTEAAYRALEKKYEMACKCADELQRKVTLIESGKPPCKHPFDQVNWVAEEWKKTVVMVDKDGDEMGFFSIPKKGQCALCHHQGIVHTGRKPTGDNLMVVGHVADVDRLFDMLMALDPEQMAAVKAKVEAAGKAES